jgi:hypothetical protein
VLLLGSDLALTRVMVEGNRAAGGEGLAGSLAPPSSFEPGPGIGGAAAGGAIFSEGAPQGSTTSTLSLTNVSLNKNVAQGGPAGMAEDATQSAVPGGMAVRGAIEQLAQVTLLLKGTQIDGSQAPGGPAAPNIEQGDSDTSSGGAAFGGAIDSEFFTRISGTDVTLRDNLAQGAQGGNSAPDSGTEAGVGGPAQGGAWNLRDTGGLVPSPPLPVTLSDTVFQDNRALAGPGGSGPVPADGDGSDGGGLYLAAISTLSQSTITGNGALAGTGGQGFGGGIAFAGNPTVNLQKVVVRGNRAATSGPDFYGDHQSP